MKELRSKKYPNRQPQILTEEEYKKLQKLGKDHLYNVRDLKPIKPIIPSPPVVRKPEVKIPKKKTEK